VDATPLPGGGLLLGLEDVTAPHRTQAILEARGRILDRSATATHAELLQATLDEAERLTGSRIGFLHFVQPDQEHLSLQAWSTRTAQSYCKVASYTQHYPLAQAGVWADALRDRAPVVHNDYAQLPHRRGMPEGHAALIREAVVPVLRNGLVVALLGVGNKPTPYEPKDLETLQGIADFAHPVARC
jgi:GAF domain-containing protein